MSYDLRLPDHIATISDGLNFWAERTPDAPALRSTDGRLLSHGDLHEVTGRIARRLAAHGIERQDRVALVLSPGLDSCVALLGVITGAVAVSFSSTSSAAELARDLAGVRPTLLVTGDRRESATWDIAERLAIPIAPIANLVTPLDRQEFQDVDRRRTELDHTAVIQFTSGTTAVPKRVPRTHGSYVTSIRVARNSLRLTPDDVLLLTASTHHNLGLADLLAALLNGGSCVVASGFDPRTYASLLRKHRPTWTVLTPYELALLDQASASRHEDIAGPESRLRAVLAEAQALPSGVRERAERLLKAPILPGYGMTEAGNIAKFGIDDLQRREGSCGRSWCLAIRIVDESGQDVAAGAIGEVVVSGPTVFDGYLDDPEGAAAAFSPDGWFRTGDRGYLDADGYLYLTGRLAETINRGGETISPEEIDRALASHPAVAEAAVFPVPDERLGEDLVAAVVLTPEATADARTLREWLLGRLSPHKVPRRMWIIDALPRTPSGKVLRQMLSGRFLNEPG